MSTATEQPSTRLKLNQRQIRACREILVTRLLNTDFCPQFNRYVYWLKEPVGWFALAATASLLVGAFLSPIGWTLAAGLIAMIVAGLALPWIAVRYAECKLEPVIGEINELETSQLMLTVRNRLPLPLWGLMVQGYLATPVVQTGLIGDASLDLDAKPDVGLACVPPLCDATFRLSIRPEYRGFYPVEVPLVACAFPFRYLDRAAEGSANVTPVTVWPKRVDLSGLLDIGGATKCRRRSRRACGNFRRVSRRTSISSRRFVAEYSLGSNGAHGFAGGLRSQRSSASNRFIGTGYSPNRWTTSLRRVSTWHGEFASLLVSQSCFVPGTYLFSWSSTEKFTSLAAGKLGLKQSLDLLAAIPLDYQIEVGCRSRSGQVPSVDANLRWIASIRSSEFAIIT